jgi:hypothetical protein
MCVRIHWPLAEIKTGKSFPRQQEEYFPLLCAPFCIVEEKIHGRLLGPRGVLIDAGKIVLCRSGTFSSAAHIHRSESGSMTQLNKTFCFLFTCITVFFKSFSATISLS